MIHTRSTVSTTHTSLQAGMLFTGPARGHIEFFGGRNWLRNWPPGTSSLAVGEEKLFTGDDEEKNKISRAGEGPFVWS